MTSEFAPGVSDPADFTVDDVVAALASADESERQRVLDLEADGKARKGILESEPPAPPTAPTPETLAALNDGDTSPPEPEPAPVDDGPQVGDHLEDTEDGYGRVVVSPDGLPTDASREAAEQERPALV